MSELTTRFEVAFMVEDVKLKILSERQDEWEKKIADFEIFLKKLLTQYKSLRKQLKGLIDVKNTQIDTQSKTCSFNLFIEEIVKILHKFEERSLNFYCEAN